uniref:glycoside hydrolase family 16 protein n=1 Tax=Roseivirga sp. TaxID=1964215 RepID=UPI00404816D2
MKKPLLTVIFLSTFIVLGCQHKTPKLVWSDEFENVGTLNSDKWTAYVGDGCPGICGFGNNELQYYTDAPENVLVEDGKLIITARKDSMVNSAYTSAKVISKGKGDFKYGRIEVMAKLPEGLGSWPAIWMLPTNKSEFGWPKSGEIDIMEHVGYNQGMIYGTVHTESFNHIKGTQKGDSILVSTASSQFHEYAIEWTDNKIDWFLDGENYHTFDNTGNGIDAWPFDQPFYLIFNIAVGGNWGGKFGVNDEIWPQTLQIDYVRIYEF